MAVTLLCAADAGAARVAVLRSGRVGPFEEAVNAMAATLKGNPRQPEILYFDLEGGPAAAASALAGVRESAPSVVVSVGSVATSTALAADPPLDVPIVFSMVLYPAASGFLGGRARVTGASLDVPFDVQLGYLQRLLPRARRIGVLYSPEETGSVIAAARPAAERYGLELISEEVDEPSRAPLVLDSLMQKVDALWTVADSGVFTPQTTPTLLLAALRHRMPLIGLSPGHVRSGALAALVVDYEEVGRQTAELVVRVLEAPSSEVPVTAPRRVTLALNLKTAELLGLQIPKELLEEARIVVR